METIFQENSFKREKNYYLTHRRLSSSNPALILIRSDFNSWDILNPEK
jgi:hypothetical protein